jgi:hypothetical protein
VEPDHAGSPQSVHSSMRGLETASPSPLPLQEQNLLNPLPPHHAQDWQVRVREDAQSPTMDEMVLWKAQAVHVPAGGSWRAAEPTYDLQADDVVFCLPDGTGIHVRYHLPFSDGTVEQTLHRWLLVERLTLMHQLSDIILTAEEEQQIQANMNPIRLDFMIGNQGHEVMHTPANMQRTIRQLQRTVRTSVSAYSGRLHRRGTI